jgi:hypothetical protein
MSFLSNLFTQNIKTGKDIPAIMPKGALDQINNGILPTIHTDNIILTSNEKCHFSERAIMVTEKIMKRTQGRSNGFNIRLMKGVTYRTGRYSGKPVEERSIECHKGLIYVTNKRIIFISDVNGFDKKYRYLTACVPYADGVKLQFGKTTYTLLVPDGNVLSRIIVMVNNE